VVFVTTLVYKLVLFSPRLCRGKGGTNAHVKKSLGGIANNEGYEASRSWDEEDERIKRVEIVSEGSLLVVWNYTTVGQNHTIVHDNNTTFSSEHATLSLQSLVLSFKSPTTWLITNSPAWSIQSTTL
jgi:hypothetical protein